MYEALAYFSANVRHAGLVKLLKLMYYLDLMHFRRTGRTVTGLVYEAWKMGPVPPMLYDEFNSESSELHKRFDVKKFVKASDDMSPTIDTDAEELERADNARRGSYYLPGSLKSRSRYQHLHLTKREHQLAEMLAEIFREATAEHMSDISHSKFGPWAKALHKAKKLGIDRPEIDLLEGVVAAGSSAEELPVEEIRDLLAEREALEQRLN